VTDAARKIELKHVVLTSVNRDEREDGGAPIYAECHRQLREAIEGVTIESLIPDFRGVWEALQIVIDTPPDVLSHNLETVPRLYREVRPQAKYERSLELLQRCKEQGLRTKTGIMVGFGERPEEIVELMQDCVDHDVDVLTIGQYMQPTKMHHPVEKWVHPDQFAKYKKIGEELGIGHVESGPLVRSSYHAERHV
jgi:lipoic acid synthetase